MKRLKTGDVLAINTKKGIAFLQYVLDTENNCQLIRILDGLYDQHSDFSEEMLSRKEKYFLHFPLYAAYKRKLITFIGSYVLPTNLNIPKYFRSQLIHPLTGKSSWYIREENSSSMKHILKLSEDEIKLSDWSVWNDTLLKERLEENWTLDKWTD